MRTGWVVVIPVKDAAHGKSRLDAPVAEVRALARATIRAAAHAAEVIVVTSDPLLPGELAGEPGVRVVVETREEGIAAAIARGLAAIDDAGAHRAALLGDVAGLEPDELAEALRRAEGVDRAFVPDADGTGTTLVTARSGVDWVAAFGPASAARHAELGLVELALPAGSGLRRDIDLPAHLAAWRSAQQEEEAREIAAATMRAEESSSRIQRG